MLDCVCHTLQNRRILAYTHVARTISVCVMCITYSAGLKLTVGQSSWALSLLLIAVLYLMYSCHSKTLQYKADTHTLHTVVLLLIITAVTPVTLVILVTSMAVNAAVVLAAAVLMVRRSSSSNSNSSNNSNSSSSSNNRMMLLLLVIKSTRQLLHWASL
jgi:hypothetical protein